MLLEWMLLHGLSVFQRSNDKVVVDALTDLCPLSLTLAFCICLLSVALFLLLERQGGG